MVRIDRKFETLGFIQRIPPPLGHITFSVTHRCPKHDFVVARRDFVRCLLLLTIGNRSIQKGALQGRRQLALLRRFEKYIKCPNRFGCNLGQPKLNTHSTQGFKKAVKAF
ncbi:hypothetical protein N7G274_000022 [Stereocaulon virgatum]|uniref:Uncharacterized protein n=1 Tax=Stereocaulon virgatum TaxID=373712 RepID=A0ABR4ATF5_9LECA